jgi:drug/metabolite transporter (DMT)-like permease
MKKLLKEIIQELNFVLKGKTLDTLLPPLVFIISLNQFDLKTAILASLILSFLLLLIRFLKKEKVFYALLGLIGILIASVFSILGNNPKTFFIPDVLGSFFVVLLVVYTLIVKRPLAIYASHLTRGWPLDWFLRKDVLPAYKEVTYVWLFYFIFRLVMDVWFFSQNQLERLVWFNTVVGYPLLILVLIISYVYGIYRLRKLNGPSVDEFIQGKEPPFRGQTKGF